MLSKLKNSIYIKFLFGVLGLHMLNISIDNPEYTPIDSSVQLSFNEQESMVELLFEKILGFEDAFDEYDDNDSEESKQENNIKTELIAICGGVYKIKFLFTETTTQNFPRLHSQISYGHKQLNTPPPKV